MMTMSFDDWMDMTVREVANPEPRAGFEQRMTAGMRASAAQVSPRVGMASTWSNVRELLWQPQPAEARSSRSVVAAVFVHAAALLLIGYVAVRHGGMIKQVLPVQVVSLNAPLPKAFPRAKAMGGGGGQQGPTPVARGTPPKFATQQIVPPKAPPLVEPKIRIEPTVEVQRDLKMASSLPQIGMANSPLVGMSMGNGRGTGLGSGEGSGIGPGSGGYSGGGPRRIGGGVSAPELIFSVEPEFSEEARKAKVAGNVLVNLWVDAQGNPSHLRVLRGVGMGLDEKALAAVRQYRFWPARENGKPVMVELNVEVNFQIF